MEESLSRSYLLLGKDKIEKLHDRKVAVFGLGGVGGTSFICLLRSGVGQLVGIDFDVVEPSNLNRQLLFAAKDIGKKKSDVVKCLPKELGFDSKVIGIDAKVDDSFFSKFPLDDVDYAIDAIDDIKGKVAIAKRCLRKGIPFVCCLGMGNRIDPSKLSITTLDKTHDDPLAKRLRKELKDNEIDISKVKVCFSSEKPLNKGEIISSMVFVPSAAGILMASLAIKHISD